MSSSSTQNLPLAILAILNAANFLVADLSSSSVTVTDGQDLTVGGCGWLKESANTDFPLWTQDDWDAVDVLLIPAYNGYEYSMVLENCYAGDIFDPSRYKLRGGSHTFS